MALLPCVSGGYQPELACGTRGSCDAGMHEEPTMLLRHAVRVGRDWAGVSDWQAAGTKALAGIPGLNKCHALAHACNMHVLIAGNQDLLLDAA